MDMKYRFPQKRDVSWHRVWFIWRPLAFGLLLWPALSSGQAGGGFDLTWNTIDGGGATFSTSGNYRLGGTIGQPDAGAMSGGTFQLSGGFWLTSGATTEVETPQTAAPLAFRLHAPFPNPSPGLTQVAFDLPRPEWVRVSVYDPGGQLVRSLLDEERVAGSHKVVWHGVDQAGREVSWGVYFLRLKASEFTATRKLLMIGR